MRTLRTIQWNLRDGSTGIELLSAVYKILLFMTWLSGQFNPESIIFVLIANIKPSAWFLLGLGIVHCIAWTQPATGRMKAIRKFCSCFGIAIWMSFLYDIGQATKGVSAISILLLLIVFFLLYAVFRRAYPPVL